MAVLRLVSILLLGWSAYTLKASLDVYVNPRTSLDPVSCETDGLDNLPSDIVNRLQPLLEVRDALGCVGQDPDKTHYQCMKHVLPDIGPRVYHQMDMGNKTAGAAFRTALQEVLQRRARTRYSFTVGYRAGRVYRDMWDKAVWVTLDDMEDRHHGEFHMDSRQRFKEECVTSVNSVLEEYVAQTTLELRKCNKKFYATSLWTFDKIRFARPPIRTLSREMPTAPSVFAISYNVAFFIVSLVTWVVAFQDTEKEKTAKRS